MKLGFTGTKQGMSQIQLEVIKNFIDSFKEMITEGHHGDCVGADVQFNEVMESFDIWVVSHPPSNPTYRAFCQANEIRQVTDYTNRNKSIVKESDFLIAAPKEMKEVLRSGTWATIRYWLKTKREDALLIVLPNGHIYDRRKIMGGPTKNLDCEIETY